MVRILRKLLLLKKNDYLHKSEAYDPKSDDQTNIKKMSSCKYYRILYHIEIDIKVEILDRDILTHLFSHRELRELRWLLKPHLVDTNVQHSNTCVPDI